MKGFQLGNSLPINRREVRLGQGTSSTRNKATSGQSCTPGNTASIRVEMSSGPNWGYNSFPSFMVAEEIQDAAINRANDTATATARAGKNTRGETKEGNEMVSHRFRV